MNFPHFIIIGETKCGTTSLYEDLIKHPDILPTKGDGSQARYEGGQITLAQKEPRFFDRNWHKGVEWYSNLFPDIPGKISGDGSPLYLFRALAMERIKKVVPSAKIIIMLRDPADRLYSHFYHTSKLAPKWRVRYPTFERFLDSAHENDYYLIARSIYADSVRNCFRLFDRSQIIIIKSEDYFNGGDYNKVIEFLSQRSHDLLTSCHLRSSGYKTPMAKETKEMLSEFFKPYNEQLYDLIGRDMKW